MALSPDEGCRACCYLAGQSNHRSAVHACAPQALFLRRCNACQRSAPNKQSQARIADDSYVICSSGFPQETCLRTRNRYLSPEGRTSLLRLYRLATRTIPKHGNESCEAYIGIVKQHLRHLRCVAQQLHAAFFDCSAAAL